MYKRKVLFVISSCLENAGVPNVIMHIVRELSDEFCFDILTYGNIRGFYDNEFLSYGGTILRLNNLISYEKSKILYFTRYFALTKSIKMIFNKRKYNIIHCNNGFESGPILKIAKKYNISIRIAHAHGTYSYNNKNPLIKYYKIFCRYLIAKNATNYFACSNQSGDSIFLNGYKNILNPINISNYSKITQSKHIGINLLQIGYFCANKNQQFSLNLFKELKKHILDVHMYFIGYSYNQLYFDNLISYVNINNLQNYVTFLPHNYSKEQIFKITEFVLIPSISEGLPLVAFEAQASGIVCILSDTITREADLGLSIFCELNVRKWCDIILDHKKNNYHIDKDKLLYIDINNYIKLIKNVYNKEIKNE